MLLRAARRSVPAPTHVLRAPSSATGCLPSPASPGLGSGTQGCGSMSSCLFRNGGSSFNKFWERSHPSGRVLVCVCVGGGSVSRVRLPWPLQFQQLRRTRAWALISDLLTPAGRRDRSLCRGPGAGCWRQPGLGRGGQSVQGLPSWTRLGLAPLRGPPGDRLGWGFGIQLPVLAAWPQPFASVPICEAGGVGVSTA